MNFTILTVDLLLDAGILARVGKFPRGSFIIKFSNQTNLKKIVCQFSLRNRSSSAAFYVIIFAWVAGQRHEMSLAKVKRILFLVNNMLIVTKYRAF